MPGPPLHEQALCGVAVRIPPQGSRRGDGVLSSKNQSVLLWSSMRLLPALILPSVSWAILIS